MENQDLIECPYDKTHRILRHRIQNHLIKCRRNHLDAKVATCPFNINHIISELELKLHVQECPDRKTFESFRHVEQTVTSATVPPPMPEIEIEENWDDEKAPTYNPLNYVATTPVLRNLQGAQPAERKQFRKAERLRFLESQK